MSTKIGADVSNWSILSRSCERKQYTQDTKSNGVLVPTEKQGNVTVNAKCAF